MVLLLSHFRIGRLAKGCVSSGLVFIHFRALSPSSCIAEICLWTGSSKFYSRFNVHRVHWLPKQLEVAGLATKLSQTLRLKLRWLSLPIYKIFIVVSESASWLKRILGLLTAAGLIFFRSSPFKLQVQLLRLDYMNQFINFDRLEQSGNNRNTFEIRDAFPILLLKSLGYFFAFKFGRFSDNRGI